MEISSRFTLNCSLKYFPNEAKKSLRGRGRLMTRSLTEAVLFPDSFSGLLYDFQKLLPAAAALGSFCLNGSELLKVSIGQVFCSNTLKLNSKNGRFVVHALKYSTKVSDSALLLNIRSVKVEKLSPVSLFEA